jgi:hypothetical protein
MRKIRIHFMSPFKLEEFLWDGTGAVSGRRKAAALTRTFTGY